MTPQLKILITRALDGANQLPGSEKILLWEGITQIVSEDSEEGKLARLHLMSLRQAEQSQSTFLDRLK